MMSNEYFGFLNDSNSSDRPDYLSLIEDSKVRRKVSNFFESSVVELVPHEKLMTLIEAINEDVYDGVFDMSSSKFNAYHTMDEEQLNSETHRLFMEIVKDYFGKSAYQTLSQRKNLNIFNVSEIHVLHQEIFDNFGEGFVNRILNNDLTPQSLIIIKDVLTDKEKLADFKYLHDFYEKNIGFSQVDFERMIRGYDSYKELIHELRIKNPKLTGEQTDTLIEILGDVTNPYQITDLSKIDEYHQTKNNEYSVNKGIAVKYFNERDYENAVCCLGKAIFKNYYGVEYRSTQGDFSLNNRNPSSIRNFYDFEELFENEELYSQFTKEEIEILLDMRDMVDLMRKRHLNEQDFEEMMYYAQNYESKGNVINKVILNLYDKLPKVFAQNMTKSISTTTSIESRANSDEPGIHKENNPSTRNGVPVESPVYVLDGANFAFMSSTIYRTGLSGFRVGENFAQSWFEYENGTSHISCSYSTQDSLSNMELHESENRERVTYLFDDVEIFTMGATDIFTPEKVRVSNVYSDDSTKFMSASKMAKKSANIQYNEIGVSRYNYDSDSLEFGGKIIPSAILCCDSISDFQAKVAEDFTKYCVENGLKPQGWKMPIIVVNKARYEEIQAQKAKGLITKNSEYFIHESSNEKEEKINKENINKENVEMKDKKVNINSKR